MPLDLQVMKYRSTRLIPGSGTRPAKVDGDYALLQRLLVCLHTVPGDIEDAPAWGSGLIAGLSPLMGHQSTEAAQAASAALQRAQESLRADYPDLELTLAGIAFDIDALTWSVDVTVTTAAGTRTVAV